MNRKANYRVVLSFVRHLWEVREYRGSLGFQIYYRDRFYAFAPDLDTARSYFRQGEAAQASVTYLADALAKCTGATSVTVHDGDVTGRSSR